ncbi:hypothetical protein CsSME_00010160 [Camellia sinensis var. sinensis]
MGKLAEQQQQQGQGTRSRSTDSPIFCDSCSTCLSRFGSEFNLKCVVVLIFSLCVFLSAMSWVRPHHSTLFGFDAKYTIKHSATVQAYFRLEKPVSVLVPHIGRLEYDIYSEIGVPGTKVAILSMHQDDAYDATNVVFGVLSDPIDVSINPVSLSVLRSSLIELFLQQSNLTLTTPIFGIPSSFQILKFPVGITVIPEPSASIWQIYQILFNFTLHNSIDEINENLAALKEQLKSGLHLRPYENVYVQVTNRNGSTKDPPVTVQALVMSDMGNLLPERLKQLAQAITGSPTKNLGLDNSVFGKVKEISLSSYLNHTLDATPPTPSPAPAPEQNNYAEPSAAPSPAPTSDFHHHLPPCVNCEASSPSDDNYSYPPSPENGPHHSLPPISGSPAPSMVGTRPPCPCPHCGSTIAASPSPSSNSHPNAPSAFSPRGPSSSPHPVVSTPQLSPDLSPLPAVSYGSSPRQERGNVRKSSSPPLASPSISPSPSSFAIAYDNLKFRSGYRMIAAEAKAKKVAGFYLYTATWNESKGCFFVRE